VPGKPPSELQMQGVNDKPLETKPKLRDVIEKLLDKRR
jgi:hypothetical protein